MFVAVLVVTKPTVVLRKFIGSSLPHARNRLHAHPAHTHNKKTHASTKAQSLKHEPKTLKTPAANPLQAPTPEGPDARHPYALEAQFPQY